MIALVLSAARALVIAILLCLAACSNAPRDWLGFDMPDKCAGDLSHVETEVVYTSSKMIRLDLLDGGGRNPAMAAAMAVPFIFGLQITSDAHAPLIEINSDATPYNQKMALHHERCHILGWTHPGKPQGPPGHALLKPEAFR